MKISIFCLVFLIKCHIIFAIISIPPPESLVSAVNTVMNRIGIPKLLTNLKEIENALETGTPITTFPHLPKAIQSKVHKQAINTFKEAFTAGGNAAGRQTLSFLKYPRWKQLGIVKALIDSVEDDAEVYGLSNPSNEFNELSTDQSPGGKKPLDNISQSKSLLSVVLGSNLERTLNIVPIGLQSTLTQLDLFKYI